jgi:formate dehydrogenase subunit gamma
MSMSQTRKQITSQPRRLLWALLALCLCYLPQLAAQPTDATRTPTTQLMNPAAELWGAVRQREVPASGKTQVKGVDSGVLINVNGERWRQFRIQQLVPIGGYFLAGVVLLLILFYLVRGKIPVEGGLSQHKLPRYSSYERTLHWFIEHGFSEADAEALPRARRAKYNPARGSKILQKAL